MVDASYLEIERSLDLKGSVPLVGAKNAVLVTMASLVLTNGKSVLTNVPVSADVIHMISLLEQLGAQVSFDKVTHTLEVDTTTINKWCVNPSIMKKMRASILVMGPLLARFGRADIAAPGGCSIGTRPIDYHLKNFKKMGVSIEQEHDFLKAHATELKATNIVLEYPSVGATENIMMAATLARGVTRIINAALEPEVLDLIVVLQKMGALIQVAAPATIIIEGVQSLGAVNHAVIPDRLEAGALLLAAAVTGGQIYVPDIRACDMDVFLLKLEEMGHAITIGQDGRGVQLKATRTPKAVSFKTGPFPGFPTDLQAPMMAAQCLAEGVSIIEETVFENRFLQVRELEKMGALIKVEHNKAIVSGVEELFGAHVIASDIRGSCALVLAGLVARGTTTMTGLQHWYRGYEALEEKLAILGARITLKQAVKEDMLAAVPAQNSDQLAR
jgi:UDP-N-acetylglucosamine 1-carboxyvinyltransferase